MTLYELCEPLLLYVCRLNRAARKGGSVEFREARGQIDGIFADIRAKAASVPGLASEFAKVELAIIFFVDFMMAESRLPFASQWHENRLAFDRNELAGDEKFFDILEETLAERGEAADERIAVLYTCLGLGFTGWYSDQPEFISSKMMECSARMRRIMDQGESTRICPEAYEHADTSNLIEPPGAKLLGLGLALVGLIVVLLVASAVLYVQRKSDLNQALDRIVEAGPASDEGAGS
ncbi:MAG: DotU family type IV/VI secretion system protein [Phycisphaerales bacterium]|nr:MAG: DotU family type IV/VI secretion system protein [Phycisphaerales bacterium]